MRALDYALVQGWASLRRSRGAAAVAVSAIALAMIVLGALLLVTWNAGRVLSQWSTVAEFSIYLRDDATAEQRGAIEAVLDRSGATGGREFVSKAQALAQFRREFSDLASLTADLGDNPFPASLEVMVRPEAGPKGRADALVRQVASLPGVADVRYDREWLARLAAGLAALRRAGLALASLMAAAAAVTVAAVVRLGLYARRDEIELMELVGSPVSFIRGPFVAEGFLQGGAGAVLALGLLWGAWALANAWWGSQLTTWFDGASLQFLPARLCALLVVGGMLVGSAGGLAAARYAA
jgi:cell division transport system permease protein